MSSRPPCDKIRRGLRLAILALLISTALVAVVNATPPPPESQTWWAVTNTGYLNASDAGLFVEVDGYSSREGQAKSPPFLLNVSNHFYYSNFTSPNTGEQYLIAVWSFDTLDGFTEGKDELNRYLWQHGTVTPIVLNLSPELAGSSSSDLVNLSRSAQWRAIEATRYNGDRTSGYVLTFAMNSRPGVNYYIAYYGVVGTAEMSEDTTHRLHLLAMTSLPVLVLSRWYEFNPASSVRFPSGFFSILFVIIGFAFIPVIVLSYITAMMALWMKERVPPRIRVFLPPIVAGFLLGVIAVRALFVTEIALGLTDLVAAAILVPMGILTSWPLVEGRPTTVPPKWAVFICGAFTFFGVIIGNVSFILLTWVTSPGPVYPQNEPLLSIVLRSIVLRSGVIYLESVVLAIVFFSAILLWDWIRRRRQNHLSEGGGDR